MGFWHVAKHPSPEKQDDWSRVYYSVQLRIPSWIPGLVISYLNKKAIKEVLYVGWCIPMRALFWVGGGIRVPRGRAAGVLCARVV